VQSWQVEELLGGQERLCLFKENHRSITIQFDIMPSRAVCESYLGANYNDVGFISEGPNFSGLLFFALAELCI
jgi:hypothetical protein